MHTSANCHGRISGCLAINVCENQSFQGWFYLIFVIFHGSNFCLGIRQSFCNTLFRHLMITSILLMERQISGSPSKSEKSIFRVLRVVGKRVYEIQYFSRSDRHHAFAKQISIVFSYQLQHPLTDLVTLTLDLSVHCTCFVNF